MNLGLLVNRLKGDEAQAEETSFESEGARPAPNSVDHGVPAAAGSGRAIF